MEKHRDPCFQSHAYLSITFPAFETQCKTAIDLVNKGFPSNLVIQFLIEDVKTIARGKDWKVEFHHILRSANACADHLALRDHSGQFSLCIVERPWPTIALLLENDDHGTLPTTIELASPAIFMEFGIDGSVNDETVRNAAMGEVSSSIADENKTGDSPFDLADGQDQDDNITQDSSGGDTIPSEIPAVPVVSADEPYVGQEFESESAAHAFYNAYATSVGFIIRVSKLSRSRRDGSVIGRTLVCNKEGYRMPDKREKIVRQRAETRVGCRAMILVRKVSSGKWVVTKFIKEHTHPLASGKGRRDCIYEQYTTEREKIRDLTQQLTAERKRSATYKRHLELLFEHIEEHNNSLSKKIQHIVDSVKEVETQEQES